MHEHTHAAYANDPRSIPKDKENGGATAVPMLARQCQISFSMAQQQGQGTQHVEMLGQRVGPALLIRQPPASLRTSAAARSLGDSRTGQHGSAFLLS